MNSSFKKTVLNGNRIIVLIASSLLFGSFLMAGENEQSSKFYDFSEHVIEGRLHRPTLTFFDADKPPKFECDEFKDNFELWHQCMKVIFPKAALFEESVSNLSCPKVALDIDYVKKVIEETLKKPQEAGLSQLARVPFQPMGAIREPHLPIFCGYHESKKLLYELSGYSRGKSLFLQRNPKGSVSALELQEDPGHLGLFSLKSDSEAREQSLRTLKPGETTEKRGKYVADLLLIPFIDSVYLHAAIDPRTQKILAYGLTLIPQPRNIYARACLQKKKLENPGAAALSEKERAETLLDIQKEVARGESLHRLISLTEQLNEETTPINKKDQISIEIRRQLDALQNPGDGIHVSRGLESDPCVLYDKFGRTQVMEKVESKLD